MAEARDTAPFLYRGINAGLYASTGGRLVPRGFGPFEYTFLADGTIKADGNATPGLSDQNAVLRHELRQEGFPTAGISTTPIFERARFYATGGGRHIKGYILKIDRKLLAQMAVREYIVADWIPYPSVPEDSEVILVAHDYGPLPQGIVVEVVDAVS